MLLKNLERFGLLLAENIEPGSTKTVQSENIGTYVFIPTQLYQYTELLFLYVVIVAESVDPNNIADVNFPDPNSNLSLNNSLLIPASYIQQRSNETGNLTPQYA